MESTRHNYVVSSPRYNAWRSEHRQHRPTPRGWAADECVARENPDEHGRAHAEVRLAALDHKINEIGGMVAQIYASLGMTGQLPQQMKEAQKSAAWRPPVGFNK